MNILEKLMGWQFLCCINTQEGILGVIFGDFLIWFFVYVKRRICNQQFSQDCYDSLPVYTPRIKSNTSRSKSFIVRINFRRFNNREMNIWVPKFPQVFGRFSETFKRFLKEFLDNCQKILSRYVLWRNTMIVMAWPASNWL